MGKMEHQGGAFLAGKQSQNVLRPIGVLQSEIIYAFYFFIVCFVVIFESLPLKNIVFDRMKRGSRRLFQISFNLLTSPHLTHVNTYLHTLLTLCTKNKNIFFL